MGEEISALVHKNGTNDKYLGLYSQDYNHSKLKLHD